MTSTPDGRPTADGSRAAGPVSRRTLLRGSAIAAAGLAAVPLMQGTANAKGTGHTEVPVYEHNGMLYVGFGPFQAMAPNEKSFDAIDGTPTMYIRSGDGVRRRATFRCTFGFYDELVLWVRRLRYLSGESGYSGLSFITSAGAYVNKTGQHGAGTAIDIDEVGWSDGKISRMIGLDWQGSKPSALRKRYYAVDCTLRSSFRWSLDRAYNTAHHDHIHSDFGGLPVILGKSSTSDTGFIQAICNEFNNAGLAVDRQWGSLTQAAFDNLRSKIGETGGNPHTATWAYQVILNAVARRGFANQAA